MIHWLCATIHHQITADGRLATAALRGTTKPVKIDDPKGKKPITLPTTIAGVTRTATSPAVSPKAPAIKCTGLQSPFDKRYRPHAHAIATARMNRIGTRTMPLCQESFACESDGACNASKARRKNIIVDNTLAKASRNKNATSLLEKHHVYVIASQFLGVWILN